MKAPYKRSGFRTYLLFIGLLSLSSTPFWILLSLPFFFVGIAIRIWAKGCLHQMQEVTTSGPYSLVRHPFYLGNFFLDMSICIMSGFVPLMLLFPFMWLSIYIPKMKEEEEKMIRKFGAFYEEYKKRVPMWFPLKKIVLSKEGFSWKNPNILSTEIPRTLRFLCYPLLFLATYFSNTFDTEKSPLLILSISSMICFYLASLEIKKFAKQKKLFFPSIDPNYLIIGAICFGFFIRCFEIECDPVIWPLGIGLIFASFFLKNIASCWAKTAGFLTIFELPWLAFLISPLYLSLSLRNIRFKDGKMFHRILLIAGLFLSLIKEIYL